MMRSREKKDTDLIRRTYTFAEQAHHGQKRYSGDPYFVHVASVGFILAEKDAIIPPKFGLRLHDGYAGPKMLEIASGAGHNDVSEQSSEWWKKVFAFWREHQTAGTQED